MTNKSQVTCGVIRFWFLLSLFYFAGDYSFGQCFQVYDGFGVAQNTPYFYGCTGTDLTVFVQPNQNIGAYSIDWGDGSTNTIGSSLLATNYAQHTYSATVDTFNLVITETATGCAVNGVVVLEEPVNASIQIPVGGVTVICAPSPITFINSSTNVSPTTTFTWDFGDGTAIQNYGPSNAGQAVTHLYAKNTVDCETQVTLTAENSCSFGNPTIANFSPLLVYDVDTAEITASASLLCFPNTTVTFVNTTDKNCLPEGNVQQRYEYWNLGDHWGLGYDSIINWLPFDPPARPGHTITFPTVGSYTVMMIDSNMCGRDTAYKTITIVDPPIASFTANKDSACVGEVIKFTNTTNTSTSNAYSYRINWGSGWKNIGNVRNVTFSSIGWQTVYFVARINGTSTTCSDTVSLQVFIKPSPAASFTVNQSQACDSLEVNISDSTSGAIAWYWDLGNGNSSTLPNPLTQLYSSPGNYSIQLTVTHANGCIDTASDTVTVHQSPIANFISSSVCQYADASFTNTSFSPPVNGINSWFWDFGNGSTSNQPSPSTIYSSIGDYPVTLIVSTPFCADTIIDSVIVEQKPSAIISSSPFSGCSPLNVSPINSSVGAASFQWNFGNGFSDTATNPNTSYVNATTNDVNYTITLVASSTFGCLDTATLPVTVFGGPEVNFTDNSVLGCGPLTVDFTNTSNGAIHYEWNFGDSTQVSNSINPSHVFNNTTLFISNYQVELVGFNSQGCTDTIVKPVTVYPEPIFNFNTVPDSGCSPLTVNFPSVVGAISYVWDFGDSTGAFGPSPTHQYVNNSTNNQVFQVQLIATSSFGCSDTTYEDIVVFPEPTAQISATDTVGCGPLNVQFVNASLNADTFIWSFGDGQFSNSDSAQLAHQFHNSTFTDQNFTTSLVAMSHYGCEDTANLSILVRGSVEANTVFQNSGCSPLVVNFQNTSVNAVFYDWQFGDGNSSAAINPMNTYLNSSTVDTTLQIQLIASSLHGCADTIIDSVIVYPRAQTQIIAQSIYGCSPFINSLSHTSSGFDSLRLNFGDGNIILNPPNTLTHNYVNSNLVPDSLVASIIAFTDEGCNDTSFIPLTVYPEVVANFINDSAGCSPLNVQFMNNSQGAATYNWNLGSTNSTLINPSNVYTAQGQNTVYSITLEASSIYGCADTLVKAIEIYPRAVASMGVNTTTACTPATIQFSNTSYDYNTLTWDFDNGSTSGTVQSAFIQTFTNTTGATKFYDVTLYASTSYGCNDTATVSLEVYPEVQAEANFDTAGCSPLYIKFQNGSSGANTYSWNLGNGTVSSQISPDQTYVNNSNSVTSYPISLTATSTYGCTDLVSANIYVHPKPVAQFIASPTIQAFPLTVVTFQNNTSQLGLDYSWDFDNGAISNLQQPGAIDFLSIGDYNVTLIAANPYCSDTSVKLIQIIPPPPVAGFVGTGNGCTPFTITFENISEYGQDYLWDFGDGNTSTSKNPSYTYFQTGVYSVSLQVTNATGVDTYVISNAVTAHPNAIASFEYNPYTVSTSGSQTFFYNQSVNADRFEWAFGDGSFSSEENPIYQYTSVGDYPITLVANNEFNCPDTITHSTFIRVDANSEISFPNAFSPDPSGPSFGRFNPNTLDNTVFYPITIGVEEFHLMIFNRWGEMVFESFDTQIGWDGYYRDKISPQDVYVWKAKVKLVSGEDKIYTGDVTLLR